MLHRNQYSLAQTYDAYYYHSPGGISRTYSTAVYGTDGYFHNYRD